MTDLLFLIHFLIQHPDVGAAFLAYWVLMGLASRMPAPAQKRGAYYWFYQVVHFVSANWDKILAAARNIAAALPSNPNSAEPVTDPNGPGSARSH